MCFNLPSRISNKNRESRRDSSESRDSISDATIFHTRMINEELVEKAAAAHLSRKLVRDDPSVLVPSRRVSGSVSLRRAGLPFILSFHRRPKVTGDRHASGVSKSSLPCSNDTSFQQLHSPILVRRNDTSRATPRGVTSLYGAFARFARRR